MKNKTSVSQNMITAAIKAAPGDLSISTAEDVVRDAIDAAWTRFDVDDRSTWPSLDIGGATSSFRPVFYKYKGKWTADGKDEIWFDSLRYDPQLKVWCRYGQSWTDAEKENCTVITYSDASLFMPSYINGGQDDAK